jgi:hypothetical protein
MSYLKLHKALIAVLFLVSGCSSMEDIRFASAGIGTDVHITGAASQYQVNKVYFGYLCGMAEVPYDQGGTEEPYCRYGEFSGIHWNTLVQAGMNDIDQRCDAYLAWLDNRKRSEGAILAQLSDTSTTTLAILRASGAASLAFDVVAQAFGFAANSVKNYNSRLLFEIETSTVQALVLNRQREFREGIQTAQFDNKPAVEHALRSYLRICLPFTIETEINNVMTVFQRTGEGPKDGLINTGTTEAAIRAMNPLRADDPVSDGRKRKPLPESERAAALFVTPANYTDRDVDLVQEALCIPPGNVGPKTRVAVRIFETVKVREPQVTKDGKITDERENALVTRRGKCDTKLFKNIYEIENLDTPARVKVFIQTLNEKVAGEPANENADLSDPGVRRKITEANQSFRLETYDEIAKDQVLPALYSALGLFSPN